MSQLLFKKCFFDAIRAGAKRTTIRRWPTPRLKSGQRVFTPGIGWLLIESVQPIDLSTLKPADAHADGFTSLAQMRRTLRELYPDARTNRDGRRWFKIAFTLASPAPNLRLRRREPAPDPASQRRALASPVPTRRSRRREPAPDPASQRRALADAVKSRLLTASPLPD